MDIVMMCYLLSIVLAFFISASYLTIHQNITIKMVLELSIYWLLLLGPFGQLLNTYNHLLPIDIPLFLEKVLQSSMLLLGPLAVAYVFNIRQRPMSLKWAALCIFPFCALLAFLLLDENTLTNNVRAMSLLPVLCFQFVLLKLVPIEVDHFISKVKVKSSLLTGQVLLVLHLAFAIVLVSIFFSHLYSAMMFHVFATLCTLVIVFSVAVLSWGYVNAVMNKLESVREEFNAVK
ncbi:hypothetical protein A7985_04605 [Pseudoalteromonas luteoviolacea]|uniref:Uncharacterized protein n=1 Tax=Pseudoalteromonas luteoviolacea TaxID=43657 RepID=A0A1C0TV81_9GAMM|nr:hypothetical protein [Pseudoalteromonas luteoviolacea]MBQ4809783.1 hypothetical protein [Pseudoalteromonas luteoviolacea]OCQ23229.1 hypothetical protein A7985_04605 [Pseudoalteromonas luteoviolacea]